MPGFNFEPNSVRRFHEPFLKFSLTALVLFVISFLLIQKFFPQDPLKLTGYSFFLYLTFSATIYGFMATWSAHLHDKGAAKFYAWLVIGISAIGFVLCVLAYANVFPEFFAPNGAERVLIPNAVFAGGGILLNLFATAVL